MNKRLIFLKFIIFVGIFIMLAISINNKSFETNDFNYEIKFFSANGIDSELHLRDEKSSELVIDIDKIKLSLCLITDDINNLVAYSLYNFNGYNQFVLFENQDKPAYLIYDLENSILIEYSFCYSVYHPFVNYNLIYGGPMNYYYLCDNSLINILTNDIRDNNLLFEEDSILLSLRDSDIIDFSNLLIYDKYDISNSFYFENIDLKNLYNAGGTCAIVALIFLLGYYDTFYNNNFVPNQLPELDSNGNQTGGYVDCTYKKPHDTLDYRKWKNDGSTNLDNPNCPSIGFHNVLLNLALAMSLTEEVPAMSGHYSGIDLDEITTLARTYLDNFTPIRTPSSYSLNKSNQFAYWFTNFYEDVKEQIDNNIPCYVGTTGSVYFHDSVVDASDGHAMIAFGYLETQEGNFLKVHSGWTKGIAYINGEIINKFFFIDYSGSHVCSDNYILETSSNQISMCPCHNWNYYFTHTSYSSGIHYFDYNFDSKTHYQPHDLSCDDYCDNNSTHNHYCMFDDYCNYYFSENHEYDFYLDENNNHYHKCFYCDHVISNELTIYLDQYYSSLEHAYCCLTCGNHYNASQHNFVYTGSYNNHYRYCNICLLDIDEMHTLTTHVFSNLKHKYVCTCGAEFFEYHNLDVNGECTECSFVHQSHYYYIFHYYSTTHHTAECLCGDITTQRHTFDTSGIGMICTKCGYYTEDPVIINKYLHLIN